MKKLLAIALAAVMVLGLASTALANTVSWAAPAASTSAAPFAIEVIKLAVSSDVTGGAYYTVLDDAAAYDYSTIYYAIKLSLPSVADANAYYGNSGFVEDGKVKVTITWTNVAGKSTAVIQVPLTSEAQTLWYDGSGFTSTWQQAIKANCGCGESHIQSAIASGTKEVSIKACVGAKGNIGDVVIGGCYKVKDVSYKGIVPCVNCKPQNLSGWLFTGDCAAYKIFFATSASDKVMGAYVVDEKYDDVYYGAFSKVYNKDLYGWRVVGTGTTDCGTQGGCRTVLKWGLQKLANGAILDASSTDLVLSDAATNLSWMINGSNYQNFFASTDSNGIIGALSQYFYYYGTPNGVSVNPSDAFMVYRLIDGQYVPQVTSTYYDGSTVYAEENRSAAGLTSSALVEFKLKDNFEAGYTSDGSTLIGGGKSDGLVDSTRVVFDGYEYAGTDHVYGDTYAYGGNEVGKRLFQQTSATTVNCETNEAAYLNALNHLYSLLGFTFADIAAGNVYMNEDILLQNFGFSTSICDTATWGAYTAAITVAPVTEVPATGVASFAGFAMIAIAGVAAAVAKKRD